MTASDTKTEVRVRYAPSPTGLWHIGSARTTLFNWLFAKKNGGALIVRIEDTDTERSKKEYEANIFAGLAWLGLDYDEGPVWQTVNGEWTATGEKGDYGPYRQSERKPIYRTYLERLTQEGRAYPCYCTKEELEAERQALQAQGLPPKYSGHCRGLTAPPAGKQAESIRFKMPDTTVSFTDLVRGVLQFDASLFGDIIIAKDLDTPLYNFAVVVDDELMQITHVVRGEDHIANTPKQILMQTALGFRQPVYAHIPLILNPDRSKMSKRYAETSVTSYRDDGYLPDALVNFMALLGWHPQDDREVLSREELVQAFDMKRVQKAGAVFNQEKLDWLNREYMKHLAAEDILARLLPHLPADHGLTREQTLRIVELLRDRARTLNDFVTHSELFFREPQYDGALLVWKNDDAEKARAALGELTQTLTAHDGAWDRDTLLATLEPLVAARGRGSVFWPLRVALSGLPASPDPIDIATVLGKERTLARLAQAAALLHG